MITKEQLQVMQNYEISLALCDLLGYKVEFIHAAHESEFPTINVFGETVGKWFAVEFGRPDCIMPLAFEHGISLIALADGFMASKSKTIYMEEAYRNLKLCDPSSMEFADTNPLRAIACCLILVLQEKQNDTN